MDYIAIFLIVVWTVLLELGALYRMIKSLMFLRFFGCYLYLLLKVGFACLAGAILWYGFSYQNQYIVSGIAPLISVAIVESFLEGTGQGRGSWGDFLEDIREDLAGKVLKIEADQQEDKQLKLAEKLSNVLDADRLERELHILSLPSARSITEANKNIEECTKGLSGDPNIKIRELAHLLVNENPKQAKTLFKKANKSRLLREFKLKK